MASKTVLRQIIEDRINSLEGTEFQRMCDRLRTKMHPGDSQSTRAAGPSGDEKNDGYCPKAGIYYACLATRGMEEGKIKDKIESDLQGFVEKEWPGARKWVFMTNDILGGNIPRFIESLKPSYPKLEIEPWNKDRIADEIMRLGDKTDIGDVLGRAIDSFSIEAEEEIAELETINEIFEEVTRLIQERETRDLDYADERWHLKTTKKIMLNFSNQEDRRSVQVFAVKAVRLVRSIEERMQAETPEIQDSITAYVFSKYDEFKRAGLSNYSVLTKLFDEFMPAGKSVMKNAVRAFVMFFFEDCTIFEKEEVEDGGKLPLGI